MNNLKVFYEDNHIIFIDKPCNVPVQSDSSKDLSFQEIVKQYIKVKYEKPGNVYLGIVHRLDRPVGGLMIFARTSKAAARLSEQIRNDTMLKKYFAVVKGELQKEATLTDYLLKDTDSNITKVVNEKAAAENKSVKRAVLDYKVIDSFINDDSNGATKFNLVEISLHTGRSHQIRVQFSSRGNPIYGDVKYGNESKNWRGNIALRSYMIQLEHPTTKKIITMKSELPDVFPWNSFDVNLKNLSE
jgi:23S rRNA pseudouridine1911/1915/1917 synthase